MYLQEEYTFVLLDSTPFHPSLLSQAPGRKLRRSGSIPIFSKNVVIFDN